MKTSLSVNFRQLARPLTVFGVLASLLTSAVTLQAAPSTALHDLNQIRESVRQYVESKTNNTGDIDIQVGTLDERLRLAKCSIETEHYLPPGGKLDGRFVVGTRCNGDKRWAIFVPVSRTRYANVVTIRRPVQRGETILREHVEMRRTALNRLHSGYMLKLEKVVGKTAKQPLTSGSIVQPGNLKAAIAVRRGDKVNILAKKGPIQIKMTGVALMDGATGQRIRVKNQRSERIIEGTITYEGNVKVGL